MLRECANYLNPIFKFDVVKLTKNLLKVSLHLRLHRLKIKSKWKPTSPLILQAFFHLIGKLLHRLSFKITLLGPSLGFLNSGCRFSYVLQKTEDQRHFCTKIKGTKSCFLKISECNISLPQNLWVQLHPLHSHYRGPWIEKSA